MKALDLHNVNIPTQHELVCLILSGGLDRAFSEATQQFIQQVFPDRLNIRIYHQVAHLVSCEYIVHVDGHEPVNVSGSSSVPATRGRGKTLEGALDGNPKSVLHKTAIDWCRKWGSAFYVTHVDPWIRERWAETGPTCQFWIRFVRR